MAENMNTELGYWFRLECGSEDRMGKPIGPFPDFLQITYGELRVGPDGGSVACFLVGGDAAQAFTDKKLKNAEGGVVSGWAIDAEFGDPDEFWSDVVIWAELMKPDQQYIRVKG